MGSQLFGPLNRKTAVRVGYIDKDKGFVGGLTVAEANEHARLDPGTTFIFKSGDNVLRYLNINEVNALTEQDTRRGADTSTANGAGKGSGGCAGVNQKVTVGPPNIQIKGGGGIGAIGNPIVGDDGSILAVDVVRTGHGYSFPPIVTARDDGNYGNGAVLRAILGELVVKGDELVIQSDDGSVSYGLNFRNDGSIRGYRGTNRTQLFQHYDRAEDYEEYVITTTDPTPAGTLWGPNGEDLGEFNPASILGADDPIADEVQEFEDIVRSLEGGFFNTRKFKPSKITSNDPKVGASVYHVDDGPFVKRQYGDNVPPGVNRWGDFMNTYAISPKPPSNAKGSDFAGILFTFEWNLDFPTTGEYTFKGARDNKGQLYVDNELVSNLDGFKGAINPIKKFYEAGTHNVRLDIVNTPIMEKASVKGITEAKSDVKFVEKSNGIYMIVEGNAVTNVALIMKYDDDPNTAGTALTELRVPNIQGRKSIQIRREKKKSGWVEKGQREGRAGYVPNANLEGPYQRGYGPIQFFGTVKKPKIDQGGKRLTFRDRHGKDVNASVSIVSVPSDLHHKSNRRENKRVKLPDGTIQNIEVFNTVEYVNKADRKLWRTNVYGRGGFLNDFGVCPFPTRKVLPDNPYAGTHKIRWENVKFPKDGNYIIEIEVDDDAKVYIGNRGSGGQIGDGSTLRGIEAGGEEVILEKKGFKPNSNKGTGRSTYTRFFKKGSYRIRTELTQKEGGRFGFDTDAKGNVKSDVKARFVRDGDGYALKVTGNGSAEIDFRLKTDDNPKTSGNALTSVTIGNATLSRTKTPRYTSFHPDGRSRGRIGRHKTGSEIKEKETITGSGFFEAGRTYKLKVKGGSSGSGAKLSGADRIRFDDNIGNGFDENAELKITRVKNLTTTSNKGINPMAFAMRIRSDFEDERMVVSPKSWNENPMGIALTIDAPPPTVPQEPPLVQEGRCPPNPIWTTRAPRGQEQWYPVTYPRAWSDFMDRYAMSPVKPLAQPNTDFGGIEYTNTWDVQVDFPGFYGVKAAADNFGSVLIDGNLVYKTRGFKEVDPKTEKVYLSEGTHKVEVRVENQETITRRQVRKSIFSTANWQGNAKTVTGKGSLPITYNDLTKGEPNERRYPIRTEGESSTAGRRVVNNQKEVQFDDDIGNGFDENASLKIASTSPGVSAKFSGDGSELIVKGNGNVSLKFSWDDNPKNKGYSVGTLKIGKGEKVSATFRQRGERGSDTQTIKVTGAGGSGSGANPIKVMSNGKKIVLDDNPGNGFDVNGTLTIESSDNGARFAKDGQSIEYNGDGKIVVQYKWDDDPKNSGKVVSSIDIDGKRFKQSGEKGSVKHTIDAKGEVTATGQLKGGTSKNGVKYSGPDLFNFKHNAWSKFMNKNNVSLFLPPVNRDNPSIVGTRTYTWSNVDFIEDGRYDIQFQGDDATELFIDDKSITKARGFRGDPGTVTANISRGKKTVRVVCTNSQQRRDLFLSNPTGFALTITKKIDVPGDSQPWSTNPMGISAILIAPPCPRPIDGKGLVTDIVVEEPGNGYVPPQTGDEGYPVLLKLKEVLVENPGINYNCGVDEVVIEPSNGAVLSYECNTFGRIVKVNVDSPGMGFTETPIIKVVSPSPSGPNDTGPTGVNFKAVPLFEIERDPVEALTGAIPPDKLIQVTDLVGLKQTGYYDGRAYYGAVFFKDGIKYAGYYETAGDLIQIYDTLQESIDAEVTTPPSAIQRQGTDTNSNNPRLNLPGTPENLI